ncbi:MAG: M28 family metallopeptidase [Planctomycetota bacterium]
MRRLHLTVAVTLLAALATSQQNGGKRKDLGPPAPVPDGAPPGIATIDREGLRDHAYWLASDERGGRHTASQGQRDTAAYVAAHFEKLGLKPLGDRRKYLQAFPIERLVLHRATALAFGKTKVHEQGFAVLHSSDKDKVSIKGRFVHCGNGASLPGGLKGRIPVVVFDSGATRGGVGGDLQAVQRYVQLSKKLADKGVKAAVVCLMDDASSLANTLNYRALLPDHGVMSFDRQARPPVQVPLFVLARQPSEQLLAHMQDEKAGGRLKIQVQSEKKATGSNVCAVLEGTSKKAQAIVISAHHDHVGTRLDGDRFNGADDNASGTAGLLELAEAFATAEQRPARSIVFLSVSGEELGLWGSAWYAEHPTWPKDRITANVNIDMIGRAGRDGDTIRMQITPSNRHEKYSTIVRDAVQLGARFDIAFTSGDTYYRRSDHYNFARKGIPVVFFCDGEHPDYHQVSDEADKLDYAAMEAITRLAYWTVWQTADASGAVEELGRQDDW